MDLYMMPTHFVSDVVLSSFKWPVRTKLAKPLWIVLIKIHRVAT
jgi:hypothetical protein